MTLRRNKKYPFRYRKADVLFYENTGEFSALIKFDTRKIDNIGVTEDSLREYCRLIGGPKKYFIIIRDIMYN